ncbi:MAG TPA: hypothetical protein VFF06_11700 [Polyangia bacterium]|nr:hypothetical protein [Polyangia bacterium]
MSRTLRVLTFLGLSLLFATRLARADQPAAAPKRLTLELTTLGLMREKGLITQAEYDSALHDLADSVGGQAADSLTLVLGRWSTTLYGFVEADHIYDSTQSFNDLAGNALVARPTGYTGNNGRFTFGVRNSRIGFRLRAPEWHHVRASAMLEMDFLGNQQPIGYDQPFQISEGAFFTNPTFRIRHFNLKVETPIVDVLIGQYWQLFGWQSLYHPNTVEIQGVPGQIYSRTPQIRLSKTIKTAPVTIEFAAAMMRPPQRDSGTPEGQGGVRLALNRLVGRTTAGATGTSLQPLSIAVTGDIRQFNLSEFSAKPKNSVSKTGWAVAADAFIPIVPARHAHSTGAISVNAEYGYGYGTADLYTGLNGGVNKFPALPNPMMTTPAPVYTPNVDPSLVVYDADGTAHLINWQSALVGLQWYFPRLHDRMWISSNYSHLESNNAKLHAPAGTIARSSEDWVDANLFGDVTPAVRLGLEYAYFADHYSDGMDAVNHRVQFSAFYLF